MRDVAFGTRQASGVCSLLCGALALTLASGCAYQRSLEGRDIDFRVRGQIGVRDARESFSASFEWRQAGERYEIDLWGPLGQGRSRLAGDGEAVTVTDAHGQVVHGADAKVLMQNALGWSAPVAALRRWVRGVYDPTQSVAGVAHDQNGNLARFEQFGWTVALSRWRQTPIGPRPGKVVAARGGHRVTAVCREWSLD